MAPAPPVGIIYPPPEVRNIVDKTASFVARNGLQFEQRIRQNEVNNQKFNFLNTNDPYHAYYLNKVNEIKAELAGDSGVPGDDDRQKSATAGHPKQDVGDTSKKVVSSDLVRKRQAELLKSAQRSLTGLYLGDDWHDEEGDQSRPPQQPPEFEFSADPPSISAYDLDVVKLTAQFVARNGRQFLSRLMTREDKNYEFDFLRPQHALFSYFTSLVDQYTKILVPDKHVVGKLKTSLESDDRGIPAVVKDVSKRVRWIKYETTERQQQEDKLDRDRIAYAQIDWHAFVVVETVDFQPEEIGPDLPLPTKPQQVGSLLIQQRRLDAEPGAKNFSQTNSDETVGHSDGVDKRPVVTLPDSSTAQESELTNMIVEDMDEGSSDEETVPVTEASKDRPQIPEVVPPTPGDVEIRKYDPKSETSAKIKALGNVTGDELISPITGERVSAVQMQEHLRIGLLDPRWVEERDKKLASQKNEPVFATGSGISASLKHLAEHRSDIFGVGEEAVQQEDIGKRLGESANEDDSNSRPAEKVVSWDGHKRSAASAMQTAASQVSTDDQLQRQRHEEETEAAKEKIGPQVNLTNTAHNAPPVPLQPPHMVRPPMPQMGVPTGSMVPRPPMTLIPPPAMPHIINTAPPPLPHNLPPFNPMVGGVIAPPGVGVPPPPPPGAAPIPGVLQDFDAPESKRPKVGGEEDSLLMAEAEFSRQLGGPNVRVTFQIICPVLNNPKEVGSVDIVWKPLHGQSIPVTLPISAFVSELKTKLFEELRMPAGKQKLQIAHSGMFLKDAQTLAFYNIRPGTLINLQVKERGGRKK